jgi:hypothetical protein
MKGLKMEYISGNQLTKDETSGDALKKLIDDHWNYIEEMLYIHGEESTTIDKIGYHYRTSFRHGFKHAMEEVNDRG